MDHKQTLMRELHDLADNQPDVRWACYTLLNHLVNCDENTGYMWEDLDDNASMQDRINARFGYTSDNTRDLFDGSIGYEAIQQEIDAELAYRTLMP